MKKLSFVFALFVVLATALVGCKDPVNGINNNNGTESPKEDKSPYEYVLPSGVDYADYTYVGDYIFSDVMNFTEWKFTNGEANSEYGYFMVLEKKCRVQLEEGKRGFYRYDPKTNVDFEMKVGTKYKVYLKNTYLSEKTVTYDNQGYGRVFSYANIPSISYDCSNLQVWTIKDSNPVVYFVSTRTSDYDERNGYYIEK